MHNATTKQRIAALRRRLGLFTGRFEGPRLGRIRAAFAPGSADVSGSLLPPADAAPDAPTTIAPAPDAPTVVAPAPDATTVERAAPERPTPGEARVEPDIRRFIPVVVERTPPLGGAGAAPAGAAPSRSGRRAVAWAAAVLLAVAVGVALRSGSARTPAPAPASSRLLPGPAEAAAPAAAPASAAGREVEVRAGDTLWDLARRHLGDPFAWPRLHRANRELVADPDLIFPGQRLRVP
ncbi:MAG TPA: LysM peptidoglycan-binding domain-containing protein [Anaeromyxobacteraceae bacterium]|nr:LysM peptidoglycan-binding domain-containing protein [Anaeromyxobacteraceae bacterium]